MKVNAKQVSLRKLQKDAENQYKGGFFCCEALIDAVRDNFELDVPDEVIAMTSGMAVGVGRSGYVYAVHLTAALCLLVCFLEEQ